MESRNVRSGGATTAAAYEEAGIGPDELSLAEVYDLSTALELDWYENIGLCKPGEAVPAQAIAQVCEVTWQLRGQAEGRQVEGATAGLTVNQGLFGHGSAVLLST